MSQSSDNPSGLPADEMAMYMQMFLDESSEQLDGLVDTLLLLETDPRNPELLNEAFRLIHSIKGSSAMMGFDSIAVLTHHLENHFERLRSGFRLLDREMMDLILRCIDFLRQCNERLREGKTLASVPELLEELTRLGQTHDGSPTTTRAEETKKVATPIVPAPVATRSGNEIPSPVELVAEAVGRSYRITVRFATDVSLPDLKAELILTRLREVGEITGMHPPAEELGLVADSRQLQLIVHSSQSVEELRFIANIGGVELLEIEADIATLAAVEATSPAPSSPTVPPVAMPVVPSEPPVISPAQPISTHAASARPSPASSSTAAGPVELEEPTVEAETKTSRSEREEVIETKSKVVETVRVDIDRLDSLMNLVGELVVNKARFAQLAREMSPAFRKSNIAGRARTFGEIMRGVVALLKSQSGGGSHEENVAWSENLVQMEAEIALLDEQTRLWEVSRRHFMQVVEAIDHLSRVSESLQRGVLDTRMVPVAPLFNRFKRVVRDISLELGKKVTLEIHGENTELDKRMIDELGDPLVHLVRNAIDHGIEAADVRARRGKPETGTILLEAAHSGNNVVITVRDDGGGINIEKVRQRAIERSLLSAAAAETLSDYDTLQFIWHPGFSTAEVVSDISGRGVGMDIVKTRIAELNGVIDIDSTPGQGTRFSIRLPLTLAIIRSLLFRLRYGMFAVPIDNVREIVKVPLDKIVAVHGNKTIEVRGEFIPLVEIEDIFYWHDTEYSGKSALRRDASSDGRSVNVVILHNANRTLGLTVNELHGGQDIVIKSLAENFVHIRGLSGASILGDGSVCLLIDVGAVIEMAIDPRRRTRSGEPALLAG